MNLPSLARSSALLCLAIASAVAPAAFAEGTIRPSSEGRIGFIAGSATNAETWGFKPSRWGRYDLEAAVSGAAKGAELVIEIAAGKHSVVAVRISRISANEVFIKTATNQELQVPFAEMVEVKLRSKDAA